MDDDLVIATFLSDEISLPLSNCEISAEIPPSQAKGQLSYNGPVGIHYQVAQLLSKSKFNRESRIKLGPAKSVSSTSSQGTGLRPLHPGHTSHAIPDTQLGLTNDEIALLRHHQQVGASGATVSSAASWASSQGLLLLDGNSLASLGRYFTRIMQQIQARLDYVCTLPHPQAFLS